MSTKQNLRWTLVAVVVAACALSALAGWTAAQTQSPKLRAGEKARLNPAGVWKPTGYSHVVTAQPGRVVWIAGQVAANDKGEIVGKGDLRAQTKQVYENLTTALKAAGASWDDVVKINWYVVNYSPDSVQILRDTRAQYVSADRMPASTLVGVQALARPEYLIEVEVVAVIP